jgi:TM2 domain-containing membrane protein YozV
MDALQAQVLINRSKVKSPVFAAVLGFFFPFIAALYNGKIGAAFGFLLLNIVCFPLALVGVGIGLWLLHALLGSYLNYKWAEQANQRALEQIVAKRTAAPLIST